MKIANRIANLTESATLAMARKSRELKASGRDIISLSLGEPDFSPPDFIRKAAIEAVNNDFFSNYAPVDGYLELKKAICNKLQRDNNLSYTPNQVIVSTGAKQSISNIVNATINPGDEVVLPAPFWVSYSDIVLLAGGVPVIVETSIENDFKISAKELEKYFTPKTKLLMFSSPCNPTGSVYSKKELSNLAEVLKNHPNILTVCDEIYEQIVFEGEHCSLASFSEIYDRVATVNGVSKAFAMTGWRIGYLAGPEWLVKACTKMQGQVTSGANGIAQHAAQIALEADPICLKEMVAEYKSRRDYLIELMKDIPGLEINNPEGAFYIFPKVNSYFGKSYKGFTIKNASDLCLHILDTKDVALVTGEAFGAKDYIRISYSTDKETLKKAIKRIKEALLLLK